MMNRTIQNKILLTVIFIAVIFFSAKSAFSLSEVESMEKRSVVFNSTEQGIIDITSHLHNLMLNHSLFKIDQNSLKPNKNNTQSETKTNISKAKTIKSFFNTTANTDGLECATTVKENNDGSVTLGFNATHSCTSQSSSSETVPLVVPCDPKTAKLYIDHGMAYLDQDTDICYIENIANERKVVITGPIKGYETVLSNTSRALKPLTVEARLNGIADPNAAIVPVKVLTSANNSATQYSELFITEINLPDVMGRYSNIINTLCSMDGSGATLRGPPEKIYKQISNPIENRFMNLDFVKMGFMNEAQYTFIMSPFLF